MLPFPSLPLLSLPISPFPSLPYPPVPFSFPFSSPPPFPSLPVEVAPLNAARGLGERCKLPQRGLNRSPSGNRIWYIIAFKSDIHGGSSFTHFPENQLTTVYAFFSNSVCDNFSFGCMHPPTLCLWVHWHPRHPLSRRLWCEDSSASRNVNNNKC